MIVKKIIGIEAKAQTLKILNLGLKERMDHRLNVVTYWYLLESNKTAEQDISFVCVPLIGVVIDYNMICCVWEMIIITLNVHVLQVAILCSQKKLQKLPYNYE